MFLSVPGTLSHMTEQERHQWAQRIVRARRGLGWSKEKAAQRAGVTTTTWRRAEAGEALQDAKFAQVIAAVGLSDTGEPRVDFMTAPQPALFLLPADLERGYNETVAFARSVSEHVPALARDATRLMLDASQLFAAAGTHLVNGGDDGVQAAPMNAADEDDLRADLAAYPSDDETD